MARGILFTRISKELVEGHPETLEAWHKALCLPEDYELVGAIHSPGLDFLKMFFLLESEHIPTSPLGLTKVDLVCHREYRDDGTSHAVLDRIEFEV